MRKKIDIDVLIEELEKRKKGLVELLEIALPENTPVAKISLNDIATIIMFKGCDVDE